MLLCKIPISTTFNKEKKLRLTPPIASDKTVSITIFCSDGINEIPASEGEFNFTPIDISEL
jgi:hypothetical protein